MLETAEAAPKVTKDEEEVGIDECSGMNAGVVKQGGGCEGFDPNKKELGELGAEQKEKWLPEAGYDEEVEDDEKRAPPEAILPVRVFQNAYTASKISMNLYTLENF